MDSITHTLFGLTINSATNKENMPKELKKAVFVAAVAGSLIPDIDVVSQLWDTEGMYQMWHRGITHSLFLVPIWAGLIYLFCYLMWRTKDRKIFYIAAIAVFIHNTSDVFNAWGTGYFEPFSTVRLTFGTIPIIDFVIWTIMLVGYLVVRIKKATPHKVFKMVWIFIIAHVLIQSLQGFIIYQNNAHKFEEHVITANFIPAHFEVVGKKGSEIEIWKDSLWEEPELLMEFISKEETNLDVLFQENPSAKTLFQWAPFVVIVDNDEKIEVFDPRFFHSGEPFLNEFILKEDLRH